MNNVKWYNLNKDGYIVDNNKIIWPLLEKGGIYIYKLSLYPEGSGVLGGRQSCSHATILGEDSLMHSKALEEKLYIGSSINIKQRFRQHKYRSLQMSTEYNSILYKYVLKYGWQSFNFGVIEYIDLDSSDGCAASKREILYNLEQKYLDQINPSLNINKYAGSMKGYKHNAETKGNYSKVRTGKCYRKIGGVVVRPEVSQETIRRLKLHSQDLKVILYNKEQVKVQEFNSVKNAAEFIKLSPTSVSKYIKSGKLWKGGTESYYFKLENCITKDTAVNLSFPLEEIETSGIKQGNVDVSCHNNSRRAYLFEVVRGNHVIYRFKSITKASEFLNISRRTLTTYSHNNKLWKDKFSFKIIKS